MQPFTRFSTLLLGYIFLFSSFSFSQDNFRLSGTAPDSLEGCMIYIGTLDYSGQKQEFKDSTRIEKGHFVFTGHLQQTAMLATLFMRKPYFGIYQFFLENRNMDLTVQPSPGRNVLENCAVTNSPITDQSLSLKKRLTAIDKLIGRQYQKIDTAYGKAEKAGKEQLEKELEELTLQSRQIKVGYIKEHPDHYISLFELCYTITGATVKYPDSIQTLLSHLSKEMQQQPIALQLQQRLRRIKSTVVGNQAVWAVQTSDQDQPVSLASYKGRYVLLDFWASWCGPCIANLPAVKALHETYKARSFDILGVSLDENKTRWTDAIKKHNLPWLQVSDLKGWNNAVAALYDIRSIPQYILVSPDGKIVARSEDIADIRRQLEKSLQ